MSLAKVLGFSVAAHAALFGGIYALKTPEHKNTESIGVMVSKKKPKPKEDKPKPIEAPPELLHQKTVFKAPQAAPEPPPPEPAAQQHAALNAMPDFGISMIGGGGPGGIGVGIPVGPGGGASGGVKQLTAAPPKEKTFGGVKGAVADSPCTEDLIKAKPQGTFSPPYTDDARSAEVEGRLALKLTLDAEGNVTGVTVVAGLGHGLDEAAVSAAKRMKFTPGTRCGKPVTSTFNVGFTFRLGE